MRASGFPGSCRDLSTRPGGRQKYERLIRAREAPVLCAGFTVEFLRLNMENRVSGSVGQNPVAQGGVFAALRLLDRGNLQLNYE